MKRLPANIMTSANLLCGMLSMMMAIDGHYQLSAWLIIFATLFDAFDGKVARFFGGGSNFGIQLDSLADMVSFGVAPSILAYTVAFQDLESAGIFVTFMPALCAALRLARFNTTADGKSHDFVGLSSPLSACLIASFIEMSIYSWGEIRDSNILAGLIILTSLLMVSTLPLPGLPRFTLREPGYNLFKMVVLIACVGFMSFNPPVYTFPALAFLVVSGFAAGILRTIFSRNTSDDEEEEDDDEGVPMFRGRP